MDKMKLLIVYSSEFKLTSGQIESVEKVSDKIKVSYVAGEAVTQDDVRDAEIIFGWVGVNLLRFAEKLRWIHLPSAGSDRYNDRRNYCREDVIITKSSGVYGTPISEHILAMFLAFNRNLPAYFRHQQKNAWERETRETKELKDATVGILGLGDIGSELAKRLRPFGSRIVAIKRSPGKCPSLVDELYGMDGLEKLIKQSDYIAVCLPGTPETNHLIGEAQLRMMRGNCVLVNIGRGKIIDQAALVKALQQGWIAGAGLDVTDPEPLPGDSPLWQLENVIITPHSSGKSPRNNERRLALFLDLLERFVNEKEMFNVVEPGKGY